MLLTQAEIEDVLRKTLPGVQEKDIRGAAKSLMEATGKWQEVNLSETLGAEISVQCRDICALGQAYDKGLHIRAFVAKET